MHKICISAGKTRTPRPGWICGAFPWRNAWRSRRGREEQQRDFVVAFSFAEIAYYSLLFDWCANSRGKKSKTKGKRRKIKRKQKDEARIANHLRGTFDRRCLSFSSLARSPVLSLSRISLSLDARRQRSYQVAWETGSAACLLARSLATSSNEKRDTILGSDGGDALSRESLVKVTRTLRGSTWNPWTFQAPL